MTESEDHLSLRKEEFLTLVSIYNELILNPDQVSGSVTIPVQLDIPVSVASPTRQQSVRFLPGIQVKLSSGEMYPELEPPEISLHCSWISKEMLLEVEHKLIGIWEETKDLCLFSIIDELSESAKSLFGSLTLTVSEDVLEAVCEFAEKEETKKFEEGGYFCGVCLEHKKGKQCYKLPRCGHVFCKVCSNAKEVY
jgi:E3 ubiquitin-protein ligase RNF14